MATPWTNLKIISSESAIHESTIFYDSTHIKFKKRQSESIMETRTLVAPGRNWLKGGFWEYSGVAENVPWLDLGNSSMGVYVELCVQLRSMYIAVYVIP